LHVPRHVIYLHKDKGLPAHDSPQNCALFTVELADRIGILPVAAVICGPPYGSRFG
jgi:hypothetical protein